jgi:translation initiation factor IF-3
LEEKVINRPTRRDKQDFYNESIPFSELLVITDTGEKLGILKRSDALKQAYDKDLDLVVVSPNSKPPVAKMMDYSKYRYEQQRRLREMKRNQKTVDVKEIRLSPVIGEHDFLTKFNQAKRFIGKGDKVKITIRFRGRMITRTEQGYDVIKSFIEKFEDLVIVEQRPKMDGRVLNATIAPNTKR